MHISRKYNNIRQNLAENKNVGSLGSSDRGGLASALKMKAGRGDITSAAVKRGGGSSASIKRGNQTGSMSKEPSRGGLSAAVKRGGLLLGRVNTSHAKSAVVESEGPDDKLPWTKR